VLGGSVLDGFIIEDNVFAQTSRVPDKEKKNVLKTHSTTFLASILVHVVLFILLLFVAEKKQPQQLDITPKAIKSYLYKMPPKAVTVKQAPIKPEVTPEKIVDVKEKKVITDKKKIEESAKKASAKEPAASSKPLSTVVKNQSISKVSKPAQTTFSAYKQLNSLRDSINEKMMNQELAEIQQFRSPSVMHGKQIPVPHSSEQLTPEQEREKRTTKMSDDISITKYDNGVCTITREQFLGSPVDGSSSAFACGESKFDKSFREHMKKVSDKILPVKP